MVKTKHNSIYILTSITALEAKDGRKGHYRKDENGIIPVYSERIGLFSSVKKAEEAIKQLIKQESESSWKSWNIPFGYILDELYLDEGLWNSDWCNGSSNPWMCVSHFESRRSYLANGELNCFSDLDDRCVKKFNGRSEPIKHIKKGDYAWVTYGNELVPVLVEEVAMTKEEWKKKMKPGVYGDDTDDSGIVFTPNNGHEHPFSPNVFPLSCLPYAKITKEIKKECEKARKEYLNGGSL